MTNERAQSLINAFIALQATGALGLLILLATAALSKRIHRDLTWYSFCISWIISCVSYLLLVLAGQAFERRPNHTLCVTQASLIYASPTLTACTTLSLVIQVWLSAGDVPVCATSSTRRKRIGLITFLLLAVPYAIALVVLTAALLVSKHWPESVNRAKKTVYCKIKIGLPGQVSTILVAIIMGTVLLFEIYIAYMLYRNWRTLKSLDTHTKDIAKSALRIGIFTLFSTLSIVVAPFYLSTITRAIPNIIIALTPVFAFLIFSTQSDLLHLCMRRQPSPPSSTEQCDIMEMFNDKPTASV